MHTISVVIPCFNGAAFIGEAVDSARAQTRAPLEVVVVDDCSTDDSMEVARAHGAVVLRTARNGGGPAAARNVGIEAARGELVAFMDADDAWRAEHLEAVAGLLDRHAGATLAFSRIQHFGLRDDVSPPLPGEDATHDLFWTLVERNVVPMSTAIARRSALRALGGFDAATSFNEDYDMWLRLMLEGRAAWSNAVSVRRRAHPAQVSRATVRMVAGWWRVRMRLLARVRGAPTPRDPRRLEEALVLALETDLRWGWRTGERGIVDALLDVAGRDPIFADIDARWRARVRLAWLPWRAAVAGWRAIPIPLRRSMRALVRAR